MPLLDHFHPPLSVRRPWESFHTTWAVALADMLNRELPAGYVALEQVHSGAPVEIDVATFSENGVATQRGGTATLPQAVWLPAKAPVEMPAVFPEHCTVEIISSEGGRTLVGAIELISPGNKDRKTKRRLFAAKCATYLARGVGLVIVDVVTGRHGNLHNELVHLLSLGGKYRMTAEQSQYVVAYRPLGDGQNDRIDTWRLPLRVGQPLPEVPLSLGAEFCLRVDLDAAYEVACERRKIAEVLA